MINFTDKSKCSGCYACSNICPKNCIKMTSDEEGFWYPQIDADKCVNCGLCEKVCPIINQQIIDSSFETKAIAAINLDEKTRLESSSGGIFTLIAERIVEQGGVVFGAALTSDFKAVEHICVDNSDDLEKLRGSKYLQSEIGDTYKQAKEYLDNGRKVLFTGTPCQIGGLLSYLKKPYDNLYTQDIICHGVPSPMVWRKYVEECEHKSVSQTKRMFFRHKKYGWKTYAVLFEFSNSTAYVKRFQEDAFMRLFLSDICLRPSCYACSFKSLYRQADITLADFWGIQNVIPDMDDDKGISLVLVHSEKGRQLLNEISHDIRQANVELACVEKYNPAVNKSAAYNSNREKFFCNVQKNRMDELAKKYTKRSLKAKIKSAIVSTKLGRRAVDIMKNR